MKVKTKLNPVGVLELTEAEYKTLRSPECESLEISQGKGKKKIVLSKEFHSKLRITMTNGYNKDGSQLRKYVVDFSLAQERAEEHAKNLQKEKERESNNSKKTK